MITPPVSKAEFAKVTSDFMIADLDLALTFAESARTATTEVRKRRNQENARKAYDTVQEYFSTKPIPESTVQGIADKLSQLKQMLMELGETF